ncbi:unnamed protein product [Bathycoccus prasinos]
MSNHTLNDVEEGKDYSFPLQEEAILQLWEETDAFHQQLKLSEGRPDFVFYDGPPFATGLPHYGHILAGTIKDVITRYASATGFHVIRRFGWDCHGLPVEYEIDKKLGIKSKSDVLNMGIGVYNEECRKVVMRYAREWEQTITRSGRWIDFRHDYKTLDLNFMESVWWVFKTLFDKNLVYRGFKVMPYSTACNTPISNFEAGLDYRDVSDPAVLVSFPVMDCDFKSSFVAWTTTPWTLPSNLALCLNPQLIYVYLKDPLGTVLIVAKSCISVIPGAMNKKKKLSDGWEICKEVAGEELKDLRYGPLFTIFEAEMKDTAFRVCIDDYVTEGSGTGVVHQAPAYGEDDYRVCLAHGIISKGGTLPDPVDDNGCFCSPIPEELIGRNVKDADKDIIKILKEMNRLVDSSRIAVASYFVKVEDLKEKLLENNKQTHWVPSHVKEKRFHNWLENVHDWSISRNRFWGTPIPVWTSPDGEEIRVIGSVEELERLSGEKVSDLHRHFIDHLEIPSSRGTDYPSLRRVEDVFDCWFESGSMPYAQQHYPFENNQYFETNFPADFVAEGLDQTRGWFYTLMEGAHDVRIEASVKCMQNIIELGRTVRERKKMPLKLPLSSMTIVHKDAVLLQDIFSSLKSYITSELNVRDISVSSDPLQYADLRAEPNFTLLGKRLGKKMGSISKIIKNMSTETVMAFQTDGAISLEDEMIDISEVVLRYEFKNLANSDNIEAILGEDGLMILMDMEVHEELVDACIAREIVNRIQKLRKQISLKFDDDVRIYYQIIPGQSKKLSDDLMRVLSVFKTYFDENLGTIPEVESEKSTSKVLLTQDSVTVSSGISFELKLCKPVVKIDSELLLQTCNHDFDLYTSFKALILSRDYSNLRSDFQKSNNILTLECDGQKINVQIGVELQF